MPKLIVNIEDRIFLSAKELFYEKGYDQVNMKDISQRADIAVGTLYNYFSNKNELYFSVLKKSWRDTFEKLEVLLAEDRDKKERLRSSVTLIYEEVLDRRCMGIHVRKAKDLRDEESLIDLEERIRKSIKRVFKDMELKAQFKEDENILAKIVYSLLINLTMLIDYYPEDKNTNIDFLYSGIIDFFE